MGIVAAVVSGLLYLSPDAMAGKSDQPVTMEMIQYNLEQGMGRVVTLLEDFIDEY